MRCPLCDRRSGAMKPTTTRADTNFFEYLNPVYHNFLKSYAKPEFFKQYQQQRKKSFSLKDSKAQSPVQKEHSETTKFSAEDDEDSDDSENEEDEEKKALNLYYDFHLLDESLFTGMQIPGFFSKILEEELQNEPKPPYVWVHISCAKFLPELKFGDPVHMTNIIGRNFINVL